MFTIGDRVKVRSEIADSLPHLKNKIYEVLDCKMLDNHQAICLALRSRAGAKYWQWSQCFEHAETQEAIFSLDAE